MNTRFEVQCLVKRIHQKPQSPLDLISNISCIICCHVYVIHLFHYYYFAKKEKQKERTLLGPTAV